jgi:hypothetical protein
MVGWLEGGLQFGLDLAKSSRLARVGSDYNYSSSKSSLSIMVHFVCVCVALPLYQDRGVGWMVLTGDW